ncbi:SURF1 family protein [Tsuneonella dongtanensis]|uniref:SURF1-like protein n=1 Tax=Tsuneonella dongtanensis TaxID=692370 RepID=A0A1B2ADD6_9SPHN|nr:SURF1 family cytochrome oxidase biogenesis protein [Tsuneonella dongtanensis]ANY20147.1 SURF1 family protein [Tsuneonella dongtanensis]
MKRRVPFFATLVVLLAVAIMVALGFWQLGRLVEKEEELLRYERASAMSSEVAWPTRKVEQEAALYRRARIDCASVKGVDVVAGNSTTGETGWAHIAQCVLADGAAAAVALGWSRNPQAATWAGGAVGGFVGPYRDGVKLVASPPLAGLEQLAAPDPRDVPNNHLSYAVQWFLFALTALVIYALALRKRWRATPA